MIVKSYEATYQVYESRKQALEACLAFMRGQACVDVLPSDDPRHGLSGLHAWRENEDERGHEVSQTFYWPLQGSRELEVEELCFQNLAELVEQLPEGAFYPADNPMALLKGWVTYDWQAGKALVRQIPVKDLKRQPGDREALQLTLKALDQQAEANRLRDYASPDLFQVCQDLKQAAAGSSEAAERLRAETC